MSTQNPHPSDVQNVPKDKIALMEEGLKTGQMATQEHQKIVSAVGVMTEQKEKSDLKEFGGSTEMRDETGEAQAKQMPQMIRLRDFLTSDEKAEMKKKQLDERKKKFNNQKKQQHQDKADQKIGDLLDLDLEPERIQPHLETKESQEEFRKAMYKCGDNFQKEKNLTQQDRQTKDKKSVKHKKSMDKIREKNQSQQSENYNQKQSAHDLERKQELTSKQAQEMQQQFDSDEGTNNGHEIRQPTRKNGLKIKNQNQRFHMQADSDPKEKALQNYKNLKENEVATPDD